MADRYWVGGTATWDATAGSKWATSSGGAGGASVPTSSDNVFFTNLSTGTCTISSSSVCADLDCTGFTGTITIPASTTLTVHGSLTWASGQTLTAGSASTASVTFAATATGKTITTNGKLQPKWTFNGSGGGWTLQDNVTWVASVGTPTLTLTQGSLDVNGKTVNYTSGAGGGWSITGTSTRSLTLGAATINILSGGWDATDTTNLTFSGSSATIDFKNSTGSQTFTGGGLTYGTLLLSALTTGTTTITSANTFTTLNISASGMTTGSVQLGANQTCTTFQANGGGLTNRIYVRSSVRGTQRTITAGTVTVAYLDLQDINGAGAGSWDLSAITGNSGDCGGNSGITFTTPATQYWVATGGTSTGNMSAVTRWANASGGTAGTGRSPLPQDTAVFDANSIDAGSRTITQDKPRIGAVNWTGVTNTPAWSKTTACEFYGSITMVAGMTNTGTVDFRYCGRSNSNFDGGGVAFSNQFAVESTGSNTLTLTRNLELNRTSAGGALTMTSGVFDMGTYTLNISGTGSGITMTGGTINARNTITTQAALINVTGGTINLIDGSIAVTGGATFAGSGSGGGGFVGSGLTRGALG